MPWVRLDDGFADHPKVERAGPMAAWLHVVAMCYCARHLTDGRIPKVKARRLAAIPQVGRHIAALVDAGLWDDDGDNYVLHDFLDYQPSRAAVEAERERERYKKRRQREAGMSTRSPTGTFAGNPKGTPPGNPVGSPSVPGPSPSVEPKGGGNSRAAATDAPPARRCPAHANHEGPVPPCGACAEARRTLDTWLTEQRPELHTEPPRVAPDGTPFMPGIGRMTGPPDLPDINPAITVDFGAMRDTVRHPHRQAEEAT